ncbi:MAG: tRNA pseudouridine synthase A, partial [Chitinophagales bacterium]|nr:tRNA pseudouridine synthase A [Chitinophagales bacterium]
MSEETIKNLQQESAEVAKEQRWVMRLSFYGHRYSGWQIQPGRKTVQGEINAALQRLLRHEIISLGCGRTDTGVHAKEFFMHFDSDALLKEENFLFRLNCVLPNDIAIHEIMPASKNANTRYNALQRTYEYFIHFHKNPFIHNLSLYQGYYAIDWEKVCDATAVLLEVNDFTSLCLSSDDFKTNICAVSHAQWDVIDSPEKVLKPYEQDTQYKAIHALDSKDFGVRFTISANRFLRGMVRRIVGTLLMVGKGKISVEQFKDTVFTKQQFRIFYSAPAHGLYLSKVTYPP